MKKVLAIVLAAIMVMALAACSANTGKDGQDNTSDPASSTSDTVKVDMSKYPSNINEWTGQNFVDYFKEAGVFKDGDGAETWMQPHEMYWDSTPVNECVGCWDDAETYSIMIAILGPNNADSSEEQYNEWMTSIKEKKACPGDYSAFTIDHRVGNVAFEYEATILDDDVYNAMTAAYNYLVDSLGVTPEF